MPPAGKEPPTMVASEAPTTPTETTPTKMRLMTAHARLLRNTPYANPNSSAEAIRPVRSSRLLMSWTRSIMKPHTSPPLLAAFTYTLLAAMILARQGFAREPEEGGTDVVERWGMFELEFTGPQDGNPFLDVELKAQFTHNALIYESDGFYDGNGVYRIRFMPDQEGEWRYVTESNHPGLNSLTGAFACVEASQGNHGPVRVSDQLHFAYQDGTPFYGIGTTAYCWELESDYDQTLQTLGKSPFNKVRFMPFPHRGNQLPIRPFEGSNNDWNFYRPNPDFWRFFEGSVHDLLKLGIEADVIFFHPYDRGEFGLDGMSREEAAFYVHYVTTRLAAYRNVWWSMANEYDLIKSRSISEWEELAAVVAKADPYDHLHSIHCLPHRRYPHWDSPWVTHVSYQGHDPENISDMVRLYGKPVILDEYGYEGNLRPSWGQLSAEESTRRFWVAVVSGGYATHGDAFRQNMFFWKGGTFSGSSHTRIAFLRSILANSQIAGLKPMDGAQIQRAAAGKDGEYYLFYFGVDRPASETFHLPTGHAYRIDVIDTWNMTITPLQGRYEGTFEIELPGKPYIAVRMRK